MGQSRPLFVYFCYFLDTISIIQIEKSIDGVLGIQTWGRRMVGADKTTELWSHQWECLWHIDWIQTQYVWTETQRWAKCYFCFNKSDLQNLTSCLIKIFLLLWGKGYITFCDKRSKFLSDPSWPKFLLTKLDVMTFDQIVVIQIYQIMCSPKMH